MSHIENKQFDYAPVQIHNAGFVYHVARETALRQSIPSLPTDTQSISSDSQKPHEFLEAPNLPAVIEDITRDICGRRWNTEQLAAAVGATHERVNKRLELMGINTRRTGFEVTGAPVATFFLLDKVGQALPPNYYKDAIRRVKPHYESAIGKIQDEKQNGHKNGKSGKGVK